MSNIRFHTNRQVSLQMVIKARKAKYPKCNLLASKFYSMSSKDLEVLETLYSILDGPIKTKPKDKYMEDRIQVNGVWYKREEPKEQWPVEEMVCSCRTYIFETTEFCFSASRSYKDNGDTLYGDMDIEFTDKRVRPWTWKTDFRDNPNWFRGILNNNPDSLKEALEELGGNGVEQLQAFLGYLKDKGWL